MKNNRPELLAPIQDLISLKAAIDAGADAVYFGVRGFNMRAGAKNFTDKDLKKIVKICEESGVRSYLALNIIIYDDELKDVKHLILKAKQAGISAIICWDLAVVGESLKAGIETHLSTQASVANTQAADFYATLGIRRVVLARECTLEQIKSMIKKFGKGSKLEVETFIHGAMCVSESGRCFMSQSSFGRSANRGDCAQPCRRKYVITQIDGDSSFELGEDYVMSPKDLCSLPFIEKLIDAGISCFKIEGRNRSPEYVKIVTNVYRRIIDFYVDNKNKKDELAVLKVKLMEELKTVYNRGFSDGFYLGKPINEWTHSYGSQATTKKVHIGKVIRYYPKIKVMEFEVQAKKSLKINDQLNIEGPSTGVISSIIKSMEMDHKKIKRVGQGDVVAVQINGKVKANDQVYLIKKLK